MNKQLTLPLEGIPKPLSNLQRVLDYISRCGVHGATTEEIQLFTGIRHQSMAWNTAELLKRGEVVKAGFARKTTSGRPARVYIATSNLGVCD